MPILWFSYSFWQLGLGVGWPEKQKKESKRGMKIAIRDLWNVSDIASEKFDKKYLENWLRWFLKIVASKK